MKRGKASHLDLHLAGAVPGADNMLHFREEENCDPGRRGKEGESAVPAGPSAPAEPQTLGLSLGSQPEDKQRGRCPDDAFKKTERQ